jgi:gas vesicle protein
MNSDSQGRRDSYFVFGLLAGTVVGAGLAIWLAPKLRSELRQRVADSATTVRVRVADAAADLVRRGEKVRDDVADAVARGAHEVERQAVAAKGAPDRAV